MESPNSGAVEGEGGDVLGPLMPTPFKAGPGSVRKSSRKPSARSIEEDDDALSTLSALDAEASRLCKYAFRSILAAWLTETVIFMQANAGIFPPDVVAKLSTIEMPAEPDNNMKAELMAGWLNTQLAVTPAVRST